MQGSLRFSLILQFASGAFFSNTMLMFFFSVLQATLNFRVVLLMKQLWITDLIFLNMRHFHGSGGCGYLMRLSSKQLYRWLGPSRGVGQVFWSYILTDNVGFFNLSSVIPIDEHELATNHMTKKCKNFMERVEAKIGNAKQTLFDGIDPAILYYSTNYYDDNFLPYG